MRRLRIASGLATIAAIALASTLPHALKARQPAPLPSPEQFFGFPMGADRQLAHWDDIVDYFQLAAERSDRIAVDTLGLTTLGQPYLLATIASPDTIAELPRYQAAQRQLADPSRTTPAAAEAIARDGKAVVLLGANVHATEIGTNQMMNDLLYRLATEESAWVDHLLANTIVLLIPSQNPDGQRMVVDWYRRNVGTPYDGSPLPELYHPYAGHDNNRDSYMLTQVETQYLNRILYEQWLPEVYLDQHQMGNAGARMFVPPFRSPANPNVDPLIWSQVNQLGQAMAGSLARADKPGVIWGELYSASWQGANNTTPWFHNMVGLLTEIASAQVATPVRQAFAGPPAGPRLPTGRPPVLAAPTDLRSRMNYPRPWLGGRWRLADVVEYQRIATSGLLETVANNRATLKRNFYEMNRRTVAQFREGGPYAYVIPRAVDQRDPGAVHHLLALLAAGGAHIEHATAPFVADGDQYAAGTSVVRLAQPFGRWIKDILERQRYPHRPSRPSDTDRPYDVTAWTLGLLMGVETIQIERPFDAELALTPPPPPPAGRVIATDTADKRSFLVSHRPNGAITAMNRWLDAGAEVTWVREPVTLTTADGTIHTLDTGAIHVRDLEPTLAAATARDLGVDVFAAEVPAGADTLPIARPRVGVVEPWGGNIDAGWTRWVLEQHEMPYERLRPDDVRRPDLLEHLDVVVLPEMTSTMLLRGLQGSTIRPEYRGGIGRRGARVLRRFVRDGGTIVTLGNSATIAAQHLGAPIRNVVRDLPPSSFFAPGAIMRVTLNPDHPIAYGLGSDASALFRYNGGWVARPGRGPDVSTVGRYAGGSMVQSGWVIGASHLADTGAVLDVRVGRGRVIAHGFRVQHRGQTWGTFKLLLNSIFYGPAARGPQRPPPTLGAP